MKKSTIKTYPPFFTYYLSQILEEDLLIALEHSFNSTEKFLHQIPTEKMEYKYAPEKWSVKRMLLHIMDAERIFCYRALSIARGEKGTMIGFDENEYALTSHEETYTNQELFAEYLMIRQHTIHLFKHFSPSVYSNIGIANGHPVELGAIGYAILGHEKHHFDFLKKRYLV